MTLSRLFRPLLLAALALPGADTPMRPRLDLSGTWRFFPDYPAKGEINGWHKANIDESTWDTVEVPHVWNLEPRYDYTGPAWYRRTFRAPELQPGQHVRLLFGAVFYKSKVWLNETLLGEHEGGYTAFELDATPALRAGADNLLVVMADNSWNTETIPGSRIGGAPRDLTYPWWNYGGIKKPVYLEITPSVYVTTQKVTATPDLAAGRAQVKVKAWVRNTSATASRSRVRVRVRRPGAWDSDMAETTVNVAPRSTAAVEFDLNIPAPRAALWDVDHPNLHESLVDLPDAAGSHLARFGIRKLEIREARLLLNGEPVSFGGANRAADHPKYGSMENQSVVDKDLSMMKTANMGLARILHYPCSPTLLDWADEHGFLIIAEAGNWQLSPEQMDSETIRANWKRQAREMIEQGWNHPSVIAWSAGNEYQSDTPAGVRWTRDMIAFMRTLDDSRFTTFVSLGGKVFSKVKPEENSFHYADILCPNIYGNEGLARSMEALHATWPDKPVFISEFGWREDAAPSEQWRAAQFREAMAIVRKYPFVIGASVWSWNDYRSRHYGTNSDGYRHWGLVTPDRKPRDAYFTLREEFSPAVLAQVHIDRKPQGLSASFAVRVQLQGRPDFPSRTLRDYQLVLHLVEQSGSIRKSITTPVPVLRPGEKIEISIPVSPFDISAVSNIRVELRQPTGFVSLDRTLPVKAEVTR
jgi:beta-glucuronidase